MIISVEEFKRFVPTAVEEDSVLEVRLQALELLIRKYTNNNFQNRFIRYEGMIEEGVIYGNIPKGLAIGDTIQISESGINAGLFTIKSIGDGIEVNEPVIDESHILVTKVEYPIDVKQTVIDMLKWKLNSGDKVGIQSETISRHSVTYFNNDDSNTTMGYPTTLLQTLKPYRKART
jgi:hypothetical protein